jgi:hypothetical protein
MKKSVGPVLLVAFCFLAGGCLVRSLQPWLSDETRVGEPSLVGAWHDAKEKTTLFFADGAADGYAVLLVQNGKDATRYTATLHRIDDTLLLRVGPEDGEDLHSCALLPADLLFKVALDGDSLKLFSIDLDSFAERAAAAPVGFLPDGSASDGYILTGATADLEAFVRTQLADPAFFGEDPLYSLQRLPAP